MAQFPLSNGGTWPAATSRPRATTPAGLASHDLALYVMDGCPFYAKVEGFLAEGGIEVPERNISTDAKAERTLIAVGGKRQVPRLFIDDKALYESDDIIAWL